MLYFDKLARNAGLPTKTIWFDFTRGMRILELPSGWAIQTANADIEGNTLFETLISWDSYTALVVRREVLTREGDIIDPKDWEQGSSVREDAYPIGSVVRLRKGAPDA